MEEGDKRLIVEDKCIAAGWNQWRFYVIIQGLCILYPTIGLVVFLLPVFQ
uniref:Uncharacterized protein n=1 Tax=Manihot esculenta TaxID=3983 RepID=A0A2C9VMY7_MANES